MQTIARYLGHSILTTIVFVVVNILWVLSMGDWVGPQFGGVFESTIYERPHLELEQLKCPFLVNREGRGTVVAEVKNPYDAIHRYTIYFDTASYQPDNYQVNSICIQQIDISPQQIAQASCTMNPPEAEIDSFMVIVRAYSEHDLDEGVAQHSSYESSYRGVCTIQYGRLPLSSVQTRVLIGSVGALLVLGWTLVTWRYLGIISRTTVIIVGPLSWSFVLLCIAFIGSNVSRLSLLMAGVSILALVMFTATILWIVTNRLEKSTAGTIR